MTTLETSGIPRSAVWAWMSFTRAWAWVIAVLAMEENQPPHPPPPVVDCWGTGAGVASDSAGESSAVVVPGVNTCWPDLVLSALFLSLLAVALSSLRRPDADVPRGGVAVEPRLGDPLAGWER